MKKTFVSVALGCKVNAYESDSIVQELIEDGYFPAQNDEEVGVALINTCSVTSNADQKSRQQIRRLASKYPNAILVVMGCYSQINLELAATIPEINIIIGTSGRKNLTKYIEEFKKNGKQIIAVESESRKFNYEELKATSLTEHARAYLKIQDGCDQFCTFCIIPLTRGRLRSRLASDIIKEAQELVANGYQEIVLTGIHTGAYGRDLENTTFTDVVKQILDSCPTLYKLRISSIEENEIDEDLLALMVKDERLARHLHIPLQAGSNEILKKMNRHYNKENFLAKIKRIREVVGDVAITTDVIVGFPGESDDLFNESRAFIEEVAFSELHVFPYSVRSKTPAATYKDQVAQSDKKARVQSLLSLSKELKSEYASRFIGEQLSVLIESYDEEKDVYFGHTSNYLDVYVKSNHDITRQVVKVKFDVKLSKLL